MKYVLLSLLLVASVSLVPLSYAEIEKGINYDEEILQTNLDGSQVIKWTGLSYQRVLDGNQYKDYVYSDLGSVHEIKTSFNKIQLNKSSCSFEFFNNNNNSIFIDSIVSFNSVVDLYSWNNISQINGATCEAYFDQGNNALVAKRFSSGIGFIEYKYIFDFGKWKTQLEATNLTSLTNRVFGFDQTIDLNRDLIKWGGNTKNLDNFHGQTFDRTFLENNESKLMDFLNGYNFNFDLGFDYLDSVYVEDTGSNKSKLVFHYLRNNNILLPNETLIIDPTFGYTAGTEYRPQTNSATGTACPSASYSDYGGAEFTFLGTSGLAEQCVRFVVEFDTSSIPDGSTVSDTNFRYDVTSTPYTSRSCDFTQIESQPSAGTASSRYLDIGDTADYVSNDSGCTTVSNDKVLDLTATADTDLQSQLGSDWFAVGVKLANEVRDGTYYGQGESGGAWELEVIYTTTPTPDSIVDLSLDSVTQTTAITSFTPPNLNGGNLTTYTFNLDTPQNNNVQTFFANSTDNPFTFTGLTLGTSYSANATAITEGGANYTLANVLNFTTATFDLPGAPTLSAVALSDTALRFTSVPGTAGDNSTIWYGLQCELNSAGGWLNAVSNSSYVSFYEYSGLTLGDDLICQWKDGSVDGWSPWSNNATAELILSVLSSQRTSADTDDKLMQFIQMVSNMGGVYFGLGALPFGVMLLGFMAGKKTVRIFTLATLFLMGIIHASGYYVYEDWYWTLALLFGIVLVMGRMKSD